MENITQITELVNLLPGCWLIRLYQSQNADPTQSVGDFSVAFVNGRTDEVKVSPAQYLEFKSHLAANGWQVEPWNYGYRCAPPCPACGKAIKGNHDLCQDCRTAAEGIDQTELAEWLEETEQLPTEPTKAAKLEALTTGPLWRVESAAGFTASIDRDGQVSYE